MMRADEMANDERLPSVQGSYRRVARDLMRVVPEGITLRLSVLSNSMAPLLRPGDMVVVEVIASNALQRGDIVVVQCGDELITHRFIVADTQGWHMRGDNADGPDEAVAGQMIVGRVVTIERGGQVIDLRLGRWPLVNRWLGRFGRIELRLWGVGYAVKRKANQPPTGRRSAFIRAAVGWPLRAIIRVVMWLGVKLFVGERSI